LPNLVAKYSPVKLANFEYFSITTFEPKVVHFSARLLGRLACLKASWGTKRNTREKKTIKNELYSLLYNKATYVTLYYIIKLLMLSKQLA
jgi:hypothetical protein